MSRRNRYEEPFDETVHKHVRELVAGSAGDPLAPFALRPEKSYVFSPDGSAAVGYRVRIKTAVAAGDPVGPVESWPAAIEAFVLSAKARKLRIAVLGASERARPLWEKYHLGHLAIGRDVVVRSDAFELSGRRFRNLRQAIKRTRNSGVTVQFCREGDLTADEVAELRFLMRRSHKEDSRGFSMILGRLFDGRAPDAILVIARDAQGTAVAVHRYLWAGQHDISLDLPIRAPKAPNGVDERIVAELVEWGQQYDIERISLAFAPFPDLFVKRDERTLGILGTAGYYGAHLLDPFISLERLYRYLRKFHSFGQERHLMLRWRQLVPVALACLLLEFNT